MRDLAIPDPPDRTEDELDRAYAARELEADRYVCAACGAPDPSGQWECGACWTADDVEYERRVDV